MLGLPGGFARNFNMWGGVGWGGVGWGVSTLVFMCTHGTLLVCSCVHMVRCWCVHVYTWYATGVSCVHMVRCWCVMCKGVTLGVGCGGVGWGVSTFVFICKHGTLLVCHVQTYHAIAVSCSIVHRSATRCTKSNSTKQHSWQIVSNGNAVNYRWLLIFPPDLAKKIKFGHSQNIQWSVASENMIWSLLVNNHILYEKTQSNQHHDYKNYKRLRTLMTCCPSRPCSKPGKPPRRSQHVA